MRPLKLGFALEGNSDYPIIQLLARRVIRETFPELPLAPDSVLRPRKRGHGFIRELPLFCRRLQEDGVEIVVAVVDTDETRVNERLKLLREAKEHCTRLGIAVCVAEGLAVRSVEAWLLADEEAIVSVFDGDVGSVAFPSAPEDDPKPKATLNRLVRLLTSGNEVTFAPFADVLTERIRLRVLRRKCPHFDKFARNLTNCVKERRYLTG